MLFDVKHLWYEDSVRCNSTREPITRRKETIRILREKLEKGICGGKTVSRIFIRGPRFTGKTSLLYLMLDQLKKENIDVTVCRLSFFPVENWKKVQDRTGPVYLLFDGAQREGCDIHWGMIKDLHLHENENTLYLLLVAAYPYPDSMMFAKDTPDPFASPIWFDEKLGVRMLYSHGDEADELIDNFNKMYPQAEITTSVREIIMNFARIREDDTKQVNIALLRFILVSICNNFYDPCREVTENEVIAWLLSDKALGVIMSHRGCYKKLNFDDMSSKYLDEILCKGFISFSGLPEQAVNTIIRLCKAGAAYFMDESEDKYFQLSDGKVGILTNALFMLLWQERICNIRRPIQSNNFTLKDLILESLDRMDKNIIAESFGAGASSERTWQIEFNRSVFSCLPNNDFISVDVGRTFQNRALLDFFINGNLKWAVEIKRDSTDVLDQLSRFQQESKYLTYANDYCLVNFCAHSAKPVLYDNDKIYTVISKDLKFHIYQGIELMKEIDSKSNDKRLGIEPNVVSQIFNEKGKVELEVAESKKRQTLIEEETARSRRRQTLLEEEAAKEKSEAAEAAKLKRKIKYWEDEGDQVKVNEYTFKLRKLMELQ